MWSVFFEKPFSHNLVRAAIFLSAVIALPGIGNKWSFILLMICLVGIAWRARIRSVKRRKKPVIYFGKNLPREKPSVRLLNILFPRPYQFIATRGRHNEVDIEIRYNHRKFAAFYFVKECSDDEIPNEICEHVRKLELEVEFEPDFVRDNLQIRENYDSEPWRSARMTPAELDMYRKIYGAQA